MVNFLFFILILLISCSEEYRGNGIVTIELFSPPDRTPFNGVEIVTLSILSGEKMIASRDFPYSDRVGSIENLPPDIPLRAVVEGKTTQGVIIARGRSEEFVLEKNLKKQLKVFFSSPGSFSVIKNDISPVQNFQLSFLRNSSLLLTGGVNSEGMVTNSAFRYLHHSLSFLKSGDLGTARAKHSQVTLPDGKIAIIGGEQGGRILSEIEIYDEESGTFTFVQNLINPRMRATVTPLNEVTLLICGGESITTATNTCELFNTNDYSITLLSHKMNHFRSGHSAILISDQNVVLAGGAGLNSVEVYNPSTGFLLAPTQLLTERENFYLSQLDKERIIVACGNKRGRIEILDTNSLKNITPEKSPFLSAYCSAHLMLDKNLFVAGGFENGAPLDYACIYNTETMEKLWEGKMLTPRTNPAIELLPDGTILIAGGTSTSPFAEIFNPP